MRLINLCESGQFELVGSETLLYEAFRNPNILRRLFAFRVMSKAAISVELSDRIEARSRDLVESGFKPLDALHLACAEEAETDYFCTCDDSILRRAEALENLRVRVVSPAELISEIDK